jgi:hypothetical protein
MIPEKWVPVFGKIMLKQNDKRRVRFSEAGAGPEESD